MLRIIFIFLMIFFLNPSYSLSKNSQKYRDNGNILKEAIISTQIIKKDYRNMYKKEIVNLNELILLYDNMDSKKSLVALTELTSYYLGSSYSQIHHCIIIKKGDLILNNLIELKNNYKNDCQDKLHDEYICLEEQVHKRLIKSLIDRIIKKENCIIEP